MTQLLLRMLRQKSELTLGIRSVEFIGNFNENDLDRLTLIQEREK